MRATSSRGLEGLGEEVVGAALEALDAVGVVAAGGEHDDGEVGFLADEAEELAAIGIGEGDVEQEQGVAAGERGAQSGRTGVGGFQEEAVHQQQAFQAVCECGVVIDEQDCRQGVRHGNHLSLRVLVSRTGCRLQGIAYRLSPRVWSLWSMRAPKRLRSCCSFCCCSGGEDGVDLVAQFFALDEGGGVGVGVFCGDGEGLLLVEGGEGDELGVLLREGGCELLDGWALLDEDGLDLGSLAGGEVEAMLDEAGSAAIAEGCILGESGGDARCREGCEKECCEG